MTLEEIKKHLEDHTHIESGLTAAGLDKNLVSFYTDVLCEYIKALKENTI